MKVTLPILLAGAALAAPTPSESAGQKLRRQMNDGGIDDVTILNFALTLEHLEAAFYKEGLEKFDQAAFDAFGRVPRTRENIEEIGRHEISHVDFITGALQSIDQTPVKAGTYAFGLTDVNSFLRTANTLEGVGVSAYLGAAAAISEPAYLTAAGSILTVEARHSAYIRDNQNPAMSSFPTPFDIPLTPNQVFSLAVQFITSLPEDNPALPFTAFPVLSVDPENLFPVNPGEPVALVSATAELTGQDLWCAYPSVTGTQFIKAEVTGDLTATCNVPGTTDGIYGQAYVILTTSGTELTDDNTVAGPAVVYITAPYLVGGFGQP